MKSCTSAGCREDHHLKDVGEGLWAALIPSRQACRTGEWLAMLKCCVTLRCFLLHALANLISVDICVHAGSSRDSRGREASGEQSL